MTSSLDCHIEVHWYKLCVGKPFHILMRGMSVLGRQNAENGEYIRGFIGTKVCKNLFGGSDGMQLFR